MVLNSHERFRQMFAYDHWANRECLSALSAESSASSGVLRLIGHTLSAQKLWLERLQQVPQSTPVWPSSKLQDCTALAGEMSLAWKTYLDRLPPHGLEETIEYRNSKGEPWSSRVEDVLMHVLFHSAYHRGQVALQMRAAGMQPAYTDFIHAVRKGLVE